MSQYVGHQDLVPEAKNPTSNVIQHFGTLKSSRPQSATEGHVEPLSSAMKEIVEQAAADRFTMASKRKRKLHRVERPESVYGQR